MPQKDTALILCTQNSTNETQENQYLYSSASMESIIKHYHKILKNLNPEHQKSRKIQNLEKL
jgi:hypothetical protein